MLSMRDLTINSWKIQGKLLKNILTRDKGFVMEISSDTNSAPLAPYLNQATGRGVSQFNVELLRLKWPGYREVRGVPVGRQNHLGRFVFRAH